MKKIKHFWMLDHNNGRVDKYMVKTQGRKKGWPLIEVTENRRVKAGSEPYHVLYGFLTKREAIEFGIQLKQSSIQWDKRMIKRLRRQL